MWCLLPIYVKGMEKMKKIRTRFAPSPTGRMHVGNLRTALYAYLIAKHEEGDFLLRIEDTDQERFVEGALDLIYKTMKEAGLEHDEGPDRDGGYGPYIQSERMKSGMYLDYARQLVEKGEAYYCFCSKERLEKLHKDAEARGESAAKYDKHCLKLSKEEVEEKLAAGMPYVIRQNNPTEGETSFDDVIYGKITAPNEELDDMVLIKADGYPTYNFANVVDDHLMEITHVVRGNEYLSSAPKYNRLYEAFGWEIPVYVHCPTITDETHKKLAKRRGDASFEDLMELGFVPEAVVNYVALLGWSPSEEDVTEDGKTKEIFSLKELIQAFDYKRISKSPAVFDIVKLRWMNGEYIKAMEDDRYYEYALPEIRKVIKKDLDVKKIADLVKTRIEVFPDIAEKIDFFEELPEYDTAMYTHKKMKTNSENSLEALTELLPRLEQLDTFTIGEIERVAKDYVAEKGCKNGQALWPLRTAVSGKQMTPGGAYEIMEILGKEESLQRIRRGIELLHGEQ